MKRITFLAERLAGLNTVLDIGSDHAYVLIEAIQKGYIQNGIAAEINPLPLNNAVSNIQSTHLENKIKPVLSDGFNSVTETYDGVLLAGMGAQLMMNILDQHHAKPSKYILQANNHLPKLRSYLHDKHFSITNEWVIWDKHYYVIIEAINQESYLSEKDIYLGPILKTKSESIPYYKQILKNNRKIQTSSNSTKTDFIDIQNKWLLECIDGQKNVIK